MAPATTSDALTVPPLARAAMDTWRIEEAGLPERVVNCARRAGIRTTGELRQRPEADLLALRGMGETSLARIRQFFERCDLIAEGRLHFRQVDEPLRLFLNPAEYEVLTDRCGFAADELNGRSHPRTLREIGERLRLTRERVRQVEEEALHHLQSRLARHCLEPFLRLARDFLTQAGGLASPNELAPLLGRPWLGKQHPAGVMTLLSRVSKDVGLFQGSFSLYSSATLETLQKECLAILKTKIHPFGLDALIPRITAKPADLSAGGVWRLLGALLEQTPEVSITVNNRYFLSSTGSGSLLEEVMEELNRPTSHRAVLQAFNAHLKPSSRKGAGFMLQLLSRHPRCHRTAQGYVIRP